MIAASSSAAPGRCGLLFCALLAPVLASGTDPAAAARDPLASPQYHHTAWSLQEGAPPDIWALAQRRDGYLWLGTGNGLFRFDGVAFERYAPPPAQRLANSNMTALYVAADDALWIGFQPGGISVLRDGRWQHYDASAGAPATMTTAFAEDRAGTLWAAATRSGLLRFDGARWQRV
ncbi:ligand-binding sensor domain-containing protein, partial [Tahibacter caeni]|uniref:ligand-binding sensor domain-containing protein n=1 Tax=Tahibacter caeni TaxID=1453545 RepID=UPI0031BA34AB